MKVAKVSKEFDQYCNEIVEKHKVPGFAIGLAKDGQLLWEKGYGYRDVEKQLPITFDSVMGIGSVTKCFTCVAIMQLQEAGKLSVHDPISKYLPEFKTPNEEYTKKMTIHHFMTHTAGFPPLPTLHAALHRSILNDPKIEGVEGELDSAKETALAEVKSDEENAKTETPEVKPLDTHEDMIEYLSNFEYELIGEPGTEFSYSNDAYSLLGTIIERVTGQTYEDYTKENILVPAGMTNSVFHLEELEGHDDISNLYASHQKDDEKIVYESNNPWDAPPMRAAGFLKSTIHDMLRYAQVFSNEGVVGDTRILSKESVEQMSTPFVEIGVGLYYGYGLMITPDFFGYKLVEHGGSVKGVAAQMNTIPELGLAGVGIANLMGVPAAKLTNVAFADYLGKAVDAKHLDLNKVDLTADELAVYTGDFVSGEGSKVTFKVEDGELLLTMAGAPSITFHPIGNDKFYLEYNESTMTSEFKRDQDGNIIRVAFGFRQIPKAKGDS